MSGKSSGTSGLVKIAGTIDGRHKLPVTAELRKAIGKDAGSTVTVVVEERLN